MTDEVAGCKVIPEHDGLSLLRGSTGNGLKFSDYQLRELVMYLSAYLRRDRTSLQNNSQTALLMGGPKHGTFIELPHQDRIIQYVTQPPFSYSVGIPMATTHIYERFPDIQVLGGVKLPFAIYEHTSLNKANAERRAKLLDEKITTLQTQLPIQKQEIELAKNAKAAALKALDGANARHGKAQNVVKESLEQHDEALEERYQLAYDHGL